MHAEHMLQLVQRINIYVVSRKQQSDNGRERERGDEKQNKML